MKKNKRVQISVPPAPNSIQSGIPLKELLGSAAVRQLARNLSSVSKAFNTRSFCSHALNNLDQLELKARANHIARALRIALPERYDRGINILLESLPPRMEEVTSLGVSGFFFLPISSYIELYGVDPSHNNGHDPFDTSMVAMYELTTRFTAEFAVRPSLLADHRRVLKRLKTWVDDPNPHVRRFCSEGIRPRLPWGLRVPAFIQDPKPLLPFLEALKDDPELYVRRSVANSLGDIAKDHLPLALSICEKWLSGADKNRKWVVRHALRYPDKKGVPEASLIRKKAR